MTHHHNVTLVPPHPVLGVLFLTALHFLAKPPKPPSPAQLGMRAPYTPEQLAAFNDEIDKANESLKRQREADKVWRAELAGYKKVGLWLLRWLYPTRSVYRYFSRVR
jgi:hypothetical protein